MPPKKKEVKKYQDFSFRGWVEKTEEDKKADVKARNDKHGLKMDDKAITEAIAFFDAKYSKANKGKVIIDGRKLEDMSYDELIALMAKMDRLIEKKKADAIAAKKAEIKALQDEVKVMEGK
jgi:hypothetical protein